jgi:hypothetical protein
MNAQNPYIQQFIRPKYDAIHTPKFQLLYSTILNSQMKISSKTEMGCGDSNSHSHMGFELKTLTQGPENEKFKIRDRVRDIPVV